MILSVLIVTFVQTSQYAFIGDFEQVFIILLEIFPVGRYFPANISQLTAYVNDVILVFLILTSNMFHTFSISTLLKNDSGRIFFLQPLNICLLTGLNNHLILRTNHSGINKSCDCPEVFTILSTLLKLLVKLSLIFGQCYWNLQM